MKIENKAAVITGSGRGIGEVIALTLSEFGANVVITDINKRDVERVVEKIKTRGGNAIGCLADVTNLIQIEKLLHNSVKEYGKIDILVNNAGMTKSAKLFDLSEDEWDRILNVNLKGTFICSKVFAKHMASNNYGRIINISSIGYKGTSVGQSHYSASKAGVLGLTRSLALELGKYNINVNSVSPGMIDAPMFYASLKDPEKEIAWIKQKIALKRLGRPEDIANCVLFLASEFSSFITGQNIDVEGGLTVGIN